MMTPPAVVIQAPPATLAQMQKWNRAMNAAHPYVNRALLWSEEGKPFYDCKGVTALKAKALNDMGVPYEDMTVLVVPSGVQGSVHVVLEWRGQVLDSMSNWIATESDYRVAGRFEAWMLVNDLVATHTFGNNPRGL